MTPAFNTSTSVWHDTFRHRFQDRYCYATRVFASGYLFRRGTRGFLHSLFNISEDPKVLVFTNTTALSDPHSKFPTHSCDVKGTLMLSVMCLYVDW